MPHEPLISFVVISFKFFIMAIKLKKSKSIIGCILHYIWPIKLVHWYKMLKEKIYNIWIRRQFAYVGDRVLIQSGLNLAGGNKINIGSDTVIAQNCVIQAHEVYQNQTFIPSIVIGQKCNLGEYSMITCINKVEVGDGLLTGRRVTISDNNHGTFRLEDLKISPCQRNLVSKGPVIIGKNVWIGQNATIISVKIGDGAVIGANAVVTHDIPAYSLAVGNPAKVIKRIDENTGYYCDI